MTEGGGGSWGQWGGERGEQGLMEVSPQVQVGQPEVLLGSLEPGRDYDIWVQSLQGAQASEARGIHARTRECPPPLSATHQWAEAFHGVPVWWPHWPGHRLCFPHSLGGVKGSGCWSLKSCCVHSSPGSPHTPDILRREP